MVDYNDHNNIITLRDIYLDTSISHTCHPIHIYLLLQLS